MERGVFYEVAKAAFLQGAWQDARREQASFYKANGLGLKRRLPRYVVAESCEQYNADYQDAFGDDREADEEKRSSLVKQAVAVLSGRPAIL